MATVLTMLLALGVAIETAIIVVLVAELRARDEEAHEYEEPMPWMEK